MALAETKKPTLSRANILVQRYSGFRKRYSGFLAKGTLHFAKCTLDFAKATLDFAKATLDFALTPLIGLTVKAPLPRITGTGSVPQEL